jgi:hypothetical protein
MADEKPRLIQLFAALKAYRPSVSSGGRYRARATVEWRVPEIVFNADGAKIAKEVALALAARAKRLLQAGLDLSGRPMPQSAAATVERRDYRRRQGQRGGQAAARYKDPKFRAKVKRHFDQRFHAVKLGYFPPQGGSTFGRESGMLAASPAVVAEAGGVFRMFFAAARAAVGGSGTSAVTRVFSRVGLGVPYWMADPTIQEKLRELARELWPDRLERLVDEVEHLGENVAELVEDPEEASQPGAG